MHMQLTNYFVRKRIKIRTNKTPVWDLNELILHVAETIAGASFPRADRVATSARPQCTYSIAGVQKEIAFQSKVDHPRTGIANSHSHPAVNTVPHTDGNRTVTVTLT